MAKQDKRYLGDRKLRPESLMMSFGYEPRRSEGSLKSPIFQTSTFVFESAEQGKSFFEVAYGLRAARAGEEPGLIYSRINNPDLEILEDRLTLWDDAEAACVFVSGMAAIATSLLAYCRPGDVVVHSEPLYGGTDHMLRAVLPQFGIRAVGFPAGVPIEQIAPRLRTELADAHIGCVLIETPANPTNALVDIAGVAALIREIDAGERKPVVMVDNTFLGPLWQAPLAHGADIVLYSATKFLGGHSDLVAGACLGSKAALAPIRTLRTFLGTLADPWIAWLLLRSLETLALRMGAQMRGARDVAAYLAQHPKVRRVYYFDQLDRGDPMYAVYRKQCSAPGSIIAFDIDGGEAEAFRFLNALTLVKLAVSLGGTESLAEHPATMTHADVPLDHQKRFGITPAMVRLSVGVEHPEDLLADLEQALAKA